jgi:hypothetical protein
LRLATATEGDRRFADRDFELVPFRIDHGRWSLDQEWSIIANSNRDIRHLVFLG